MSRRRKQPASGSTGPALASRIDWPRCRRPAHLTASFAFGFYDGPAIVIAKRPADPNRKTQSVVVEFTHPVKGGSHQAVVDESEVTYVD